ncbi:MAG: phosphotransferase [Gemmatimonadota bacterium]|nr:phosphotransferase [Gemmatimonadota bacterium]
MSSPPWEPDRPLTRETASALIRTWFPAIDSEGLTHLGSGWEFDAFLTTDGWVFRFPRRAHCADLFEPERRVHHLVSGVLPPRIAVPHVELVGQPALGFPYRFAGHRFIPGVAADAVDPGLMPTLAREIGVALGAIHSIPEITARAAGVVEMDLDDIGRKEWVDRGFEVASELRGLDPAVDQALSWVNQVSLPLERFEGPLRFIHQDLSPDHLIVDSTTGQLTGILDWTDAILGDSARDFVFLVTWQGWGFAEEVLRSYPHSIDQGFRERLRFMARLLSVMWLAMAHEQHSDVTKHIEWVRNAFAPGSAC